MLRSVNQHPARFNSVPNGARHHFASALTKSLGGVDAGSNETSRSRFLESFVSRSDRSSYKDRFTT